MVGFTSFVSLGLFLLLMTQTFFFDDIYAFMKIRDIKAAASEVVEAYDTDSLHDTMKYWNIKGECEIYIINESGRLIASRGVGEEAERLLNEAAAKGSEDARSFLKKHTVLGKFR